MIESQIKMILWNVNGGGVENKKNLDKKILIWALFADFVFLVEPWIEFNLNNESYISYSTESVNGKLSVQLLIKEKLTSWLIKKNQIDTVLVEVLLEKNKIFLMNTYIHPSDKDRRTATWNNLISNIKEILEEDPTAKIIIAGDFNVNLLNYENKFCKKEWDLIKKLLTNATIKTAKEWSFKHWWLEKEAKSLVDFLLFYNIENEIKIEEEENSWPMSDHKLIKAAVSLKL